MKARDQERPWVSGSTTREMRINRQQRLLTHCASATCKEYFFPRNRLHMFCSPQCARPGSLRGLDTHPDHFAESGLENYSEKEAREEAWRSAVHHAKRFVALRESGDERISEELYCSSLILSTIDFLNWCLDIERGIFAIPGWWQTYKPLRSHPEVHKSHQYVNAHRRIAK